LQEKRRHHRKETNEAVAFSLDSDQRVAGICRDLSLGGMAIETEQPAAFGADVVVYIRLPGTSGESQLRGVVRWTKPGMMGVQFGLMGARETHALSIFLSQS
jgi:hypothetical protein